MLGKNKLNIKPEELLRRMMPWNLIQTLWLMKMMKIANNAAVLDPLTQPYVHQCQSIWVEITKIEEKIWCQKVPKNINLHHHLCLQLNNPRWRRNKWPFGPQNKIFQKIYFHKFNIKYFGMVKWYVFKIMPLCPKNLNQYIFLIMIYPVRVIELK